MFNILKKCFGHKDTPINEPIVPVIECVSAGNMHFIEHNIDRSSNYVYSYYEISNTESFDGIITRYYDEFLALTIDNQLDLLNGRRLYKHDKKVMNLSFVDTNKFFVRLVIETDPIQYSNIITIENS